jgi:DNA-binding IscR family transcriptional regulator
MKIFQKGLCALQATMPHRALYQAFLDVRDAAARILDNTTLADLIADHNLPADKHRKHGKKLKKESTNLLPMVVGGKSD